MKYQTDLQIRVEISASGEIADSTLEKILLKIENTIGKLGAESKGTKITVTNLDRSSIRKGEAQDTDEMRTMRDAIKRKGQ